MWVGAWVEGLYEAEKMTEKYHYKVILATVIFNEDGKVLLGKRGKNEKVLPGHWGIPGEKSGLLETFQTY